jgi:hypothetical protein
MTGMAGRLGGVLAATVVALSVAALASLAPGSPLISKCLGAGSSQAALVVEHGDGRVVTRCVSFGSVSVTGQALLDSSGVAWSGQTFGSYGVAVCALDAEPLHYTACPGQESYWAIFVSRGGGAWQLSSIGISSLTLGAGDAEGFRYVPAAGTPAAPPSPAEVCPAATHSTAAPATARPTAASATAVAPATAAYLPSTTADVASAMPTGGASLLAIAAASASGSAAPGQDPSPGSGVDPGLLVAALAGGGLGGLALLRIAAARRRAP